MRHDFAGVVERMERLRAPLEYAWGVMSHLTGVKNSDPLRDAHQELQVGPVQGGFMCAVGFFEEALRVQLRYTTLVCETLGAHFST